MVLGLHYITKVRCNEKGEGIIFASIAEVVTAYQMKQAHLHARVKVRLSRLVSLIRAVGRVLLFEALPEGSDFAWVNKVMTKSDLTKLVERVYSRFGSEATVRCLDRIKKLGFSNSTMAGISFAIDNLIVPEEKMLS